MFLALSFFWFLRTVRIILFYIYLWQLKEYHIGRFLDHFNTYKGKRLFLNPLKILKIALISGYFVFPIFFPLILGFFYAGETFIFFRDIFKRTLRKPILTKKTEFIFLSAGVLTAMGVSLLSYFLKENLTLFTFWLLIIDIFTPVLISIFILCFQPFAVLARNRIINRAKQKRAQFQNLLVIGITGSYGKTSTKEFLYTILSQKFNVLKTKEHQNSEVGVSQCILNDLKPEHEIFIVEMGAYNRGGIKLLCDIVKPKIGILTGINEQHLATFGSQENIIKAKYELIESLPQNGLAIFNGNNKYCQELYKKTKKPKRQYSIFSTIVENMLYSDIWAEDIKIDKESIVFKALSKDGDLAEFRVNLVGGLPNISDILGAAVVAKELGMTMQEIATACEKIKPEGGAMKLKKGIGGLNIIDSTYSANPDGVISALEYLKIWPGRKVIVMPCLIELGSASKEVHRRIGQKIAEVCDLAIITTKDRFREIKETAGDKAISIEDPQEIFEKIKASLKPGDAILLESRVPDRLVNLLSR